MAPETDQLDRTAWRGMQVDHPPAWELAIACGLEEDPRVVFADRVYHRLDIRWRPLDFTPNLDLVLQKARRKSEREKDVEIDDLAGAPDGWRGVLRRPGQGAIAHASKFFDEAGWLVDAVIIWPDQRDAALERRILASVAPEKPDADARFWQAMGISLSLGVEWRLVRSKAQVGKVSWEFRRDGKHPPHLVVERIALPEHWLKGSVRDWLEREMDPRSKLVRQNPSRVGPHAAEEILTRRKINQVAAWRGLHEVRRDTAWACPREQRVYRVTVMQRTREPEVSLPETLDVRCCRPAPPISQPAGRG